MLISQCNIVCRSQSDKRRTPSVTLFLMSFSNMTEPQTQCIMCVLLKSEIQQCNLLSQFGAAKFSLGSIGENLKPDNAIFIARVQTRDRCQIFLNEVKVRFLVKTSLVDRS